MGTIFGTLKIDPGIGIVQYSFNPLFFMEISQVILKGKGPLCSNGPLLHQVVFCYVGFGSGFPKKHRTVQQ